MQLNAHFKGDSYAYYNALKKQQNANYNAYISFDNQQILSLSPELFFDLNKDLITVKPMKGTKERGKNTDEDNQFKNELKASTKDIRSEEHTSELQSRGHLVCRLLLEKK